MVYISHLVKWDKHIRIGLGETKNEYKTFLRKLIEKRPFGGVTCEEVQH
jgi:hypothetical protein